MKRLVAARCRAANVLFFIGFPAFQRAAVALSSFSREISAYLILLRIVKSFNAGNNFSAGMVNATYAIYLHKVQAA